MDIKETTKSIVSQFDKLGIKVDSKKLEMEFEQLVKKFKIPEKEAKTTLINGLLREFNIKKQDFYKSQGAEEVKISSIKEPEKWVTLKVKIVQLWDKTSDSISQVGLCGDDTGTIKFTKWEKAGLDSVQESKSYEFKNVITSEYQGMFSINMNKSSEIIELKEDITVGNIQVEFSGAIVDIQAGSGLIKRCPECNRALVKGACGEHGKVEGTYDLRVKAVMDDGEKVQDILLNRDVTEALTGITLEKAKDMATEALDIAVVVETIENQLVGRYFKASGQKLDRFILVEKIEKEV